ncbi:MAG: protein adenylyltransferase SelO [Sporichthyaceae bacterium]
MSHESTLDLKLDNSFARELPGLATAWQAAVFPDPQIVLVNDPLAVELGLDPNQLRTQDGLGLLTGAQVPAGATPVAQAYAGHQFGGYSPRLGDGRALLLGELTDVAGRRRDLALKGSGATPFSRGGDGKATIGPMLREYLVSEGMHALGVPTTRALAVIATGDTVVREELLPGALLVRVAASHLRVGSFQYAAARSAQEPALLRELADYAITRHHPGAAAAENPYLGLLDAVIGVQADLLAQWMCLGFVHGVLNTDNVTISGETIDYGPCAFMEGYDPATVFSSIDHGGRYAYGNQPEITLWNLTRFAEALLPLLHAETADAVTAATTELDTFVTRFETAWLAGMAAKVGVPGLERADSLLHGLLALMQTERIDWTGGFRSLSALARGDAAAARDRYLDREAFDVWSVQWLRRLDVSPGGRATAIARMDAANPVYIPRNHLVEAALAAAGAGDLGPAQDLLAALREPFTERPGLEAYAEPDPGDSGAYRTFCGT